MSSLANLNPVRAKERWFVLMKRHQENRRNQGEQLSKTWDNLTVPGQRASAHAPKIAEAKSTTRKGTTVRLKTPSFQFP